jgi:probable rRNA maturation factor
MPHGSNTHNAIAGGIAVSLANEQSDHAVDAQRLVEAARRVLADAGVASAAISLAVVDDPTIHVLNRRFLDHDWPTDVLSFVLEQVDDHLEGEVVISADMAASSAAELGCTPADEQLLYVIHGMLHLVGYDDKSPDDAARMRAAECEYLDRLGVGRPHRPVRGEAAL